MCNWLIENLEHWMEPFVCFVAVHICQLISWNVYRNGSIEMSFLTILKKYSNLRNRRFPGKISRLIFDM